MLYFNLLLPFYKYLDFILNIVCCLSPVIFLFVRTSAVFFGVAWVVNVVVEMFMFEVLILQRSTIFVILSLVAVF